MSALVQTAAFTTFVTFFKLVKPDHRQIRRFSNIIIQMTFKYTNFYAGCSFMGPRWLLYPICILSYPIL